MLVHLIKLASVNRPPLVTSFMPLLPGSIIQAGFLLSMYVKKIFAVSEHYEYLSLVFSNESKRVPTKIS